MTDRSFQRSNDESRERLARLAAALTPTQLHVDLGEGWTVASALAHMGFWDRWQAERWAEMLAGNWSAADESVLAAEHLANEALHPYWAAIDAEDVPVLALEAATRLDALIATSPDATVDALEGGPSAFLLHRHRHRGEHIDHIERALAAAGEALPAEDGPADRSFVERNEASRRRLASVVERLRESDLALPTEEGGWSVAQVLGHLAFWDRSMATRWRMAMSSEAGVAAGPIGIPGEMTDAINVPLATLLDAWTARIGLDVGAQALAAAESVDRLIEDVAESVPDTLIRAMPNSVGRWTHRESHLDQIDRAIARNRPAPTAAPGSHVERNAASLARLRGLLGQLALADLARPVGDGSWTVGQVLGHMAFWDRFLAARWRTALAVGPAAQPAQMPHEVSDMLNDGLAPTWARFASEAGRAVIDDTLAAAEEVDRIIAGLPAESPIASILDQRPALIDRSIHRTEHLDALEAALAGRRGR